MATKKNTKKSTKKSTKKNTKKIEPIKVYDFSVTRVTPYDDFYFFDLILNGVRIYGVKLIEGENGRFIGFPSKKPSKKGGKWYNHVWAPLSEDDTVEIIAAVMEYDDDDDGDDDDDDDGDDDDDDDGDDYDDLPF